MENYTLGLALFDYLPVIAAGFGLYLICKYCARLGKYRSLWIVAIPVIALIGGTLKASWKLIYALNGADHRWMSDQLFFFLASAYVLMAVFVIRAMRANKRGDNLAHDWWRGPLAAVVVVVGLALYLKSSGEGRTWSILLLATLSLANLVFLLTLVSHAWQRRNWIAAIIFVVNLALSYVLVGLARMEQTAELQWIEEFLNLANNGLLAVGAWNLNKGLASDY
ncbi:MAG: hypothetical protein ACR2QZ_00250 [Woeseiaceae bacterium]